MLKVLLIGDSIRMSYHDKVKERLDGEAVVLGPEENCRFSAYTLFNLAGWASDDDYDVIHWNNGQWDTCYMPDGKIHTPLVTYLDYQERIAGILVKKAKRLVFAATTPVWPEMWDTDHIHRRRNEDIDAYNTAATELLSGLGVEINDLSTPMVGDMKRYICDDMVHLTDEGSSFCADRVAAAVRSEP